MLFSPPLSMLLADYKQEVVIYAKPVTYFLKVPQWKDGTY